MTAEITLERAQDLLADEHTRSGAYSYLKAVIRTELERLLAKAAVKARFRGIFRWALDSVERGEITHITDTTALGELDVEVKACTELGNAFRCSTSPSEG